MRSIFTNKTLTVASKVQTFKRLGALTLSTFSTLSAVLGRSLDIIRYNSIYCPATGSCCAFFPLRKQHKCCRIELGVLARIVSNSGEMGIDGPQSRAICASSKTTFLLEDKSRSSVVIDLHPPRGAGAECPIPQIDPMLGSGAFRDITSGNNGVFQVAIGWDACTGLGSPVGSMVLLKMRVSLHVL